MRRMMSLKIEHLTEPELIFSEGKKHLDPKIGLMLHGPSSWKRDADRPGDMIRAAVIGTSESMSLFREFLEKMRRRIAPSERKPWKRDFPGLGINSALHFNIDIGKEMEGIISKEDEDSILNVEGRDNKILRASEVYESNYDDLMTSIHPHPDIVYVLISRRLMDVTKDPRYDTERIVFARRTMNKKVKWEETPLFDFHHFIKVIGFKYNVASQVVRPSTLEYEGGQDEATTAWNFAVASYYKATGTPWKLADLDEEACYVGISFYQEPGEEGSNMRASMAHVYLRSGESQVIRGKPFRWVGEGGKNRSPQLTTEQASEVLTDVVELFKRQRRKVPARVVIHKSSPYTDEEVQGFSSAVGDSYLDLVHIRKNSGVRLYIQDNPYPPLRGTLLREGDTSPAILYTTGFIPALGTYPGGTIPEPISFSWARRDSGVSLLAKDILALTKLDWNNSDFCTALPVTISVSQKVGDILAESRARDVVPPNNYRYYM
jgi:hypothetical protein